MGEVENININDVLAGLQKSGRLNKNDKKWVTGKLEEQRQHENILALTKACGDNPDLPFVIMFLAGTLGLSITTFVDNIGKKEEDKDTQTARDLLNKYGEKGLDISILFMGGLTGGLAKERIKDEIFGDFGDPDNWVSYATASLKTLTGGVTVFAASILTLRAIFGNSIKDGGMASLIGMGV